MMRSASSVLVLVLVGCCQSALAQQDRYRVAGTVLIPQGRSTAIIVRAPEDTVTVAVGDVLDDGRVVEISEQHVRVSFPGRDLLLPLTGGPAEVVPTPTASVLSRAPEGQETTGSPQEQSYSRNVPAKQLLFAIDELNVKLEREGLTASDREDSGPALTRLLDELIGFPAGAVIREINGQSFSSVAEGLEIVQNALELEQPAALRFALAGAGGSRPLYVFPQ